MKRKYSIIIAILAALLVPCLLIAAGTVTQTYQQVYSSEGITNLATLTFEWTTDSSSGASATTSATISDEIAGKYVVAAITEPDATDYPTNGYSITILDSNSADIMGSVLSSRSSGSVQQATPYIGALYGPRPVGGAITLSVSGAGSGKSGIVVLYLSRQR